MSNQGFPSADHSKRVQKRPGLVSCWWGLISDAGGLVPPQGAEGNERRIAVEPELEAITLQLLGSLRQFFESCLERGNVELGTLAQSFTDTCRSLFCADAALYVISESGEFERRGVAPLPSRIRARVSGETVPPGIRLVSSVECLRPVGESNYEQSGSVCFPASASGIFFVPLWREEDLLGLVLVRLPAEDRLTQIEEEILLSLCGYLGAWFRHDPLVATKQEDRRAQLENPEHSETLERRSEPTCHDTDGARVRYERDHGLVGKSEVFLETLDRAVQWAQADEPVLIVGETGTGKELIARMIHACSNRKGGPFVTLNCPAIPRDLAESELFGHERGAFTGATDSRAGKFELADGGTLFMDEIADLPYPLQAKLLRVLQECEIDRIGGTKPKKVNVRIIAATNRDLTEAVDLGQFRHDLFFRLSALPLVVPPLRHRPGDAEHLAWYFLQEARKRYRKDVRGFTQAALVILRQHSWPGNVRQLKHTVERAVLTEPGPFIDLPDLSEARASAEPLTLNGLLKLEKAQRVAAVLKQTRGNCAQAARELGMSRGNFARLLKTLGLNPGYFQR